MTGKTPDRRAHNRIDFAAPVMFELAGQQLDCILHDISLRGALVTLPDNHPEVFSGDTGRLLLPLSGIGGIEMHVSVSWRRQALLGLYCDSMDLDSITHLRRLVELNLGDTSLLDRELDALRFEP